MTWDYVIVGAGSAGCVLAARLTEDPDVRVLLLEADGPDSIREMVIPAAFSHLFKTEHDGDYTTEPEPGGADRGMYWPRGKVLGGSSTINAMIYIRGHRADYDGWRDAGCHGWGYDQVLPLFRRSEDNSRGSDCFHGVGGPLKVSDQRSPSPLSLDYLEAAHGAGFAHNADFNGAEQDGIGLYQVIQKAGKRASTATAFLRPARKRPNLEVRTQVTATRIVVEQGRARGVEIEAGGIRTIVRADREVLLCAGAVNTPALLLLSGIGPPDELRALGLDVVLESPQVGRGLQDHLSVGLVFTAGLPVTYFGADKRVGNIANYLLRRRGPFSSNLAEAGGFLRSNASVAAPDLQLLFAPAMFVEHGQGDAPGHRFSVGAYLLTPQSRGSITLRSADPLEKPAVRAGYLSESADLDVLVEGIRRCAAIADQPALRRHSSGRYQPPAIEDDAGLRADIRARAETIYHPTSTAAMGAEPGAVCDPELRVRGVQGLRVVDASVLPAVPRGNTNAPVIMVAERAAELLREGAS